MEIKHIPDEQLIAYAAKELNGIQSGIISNHILACAECNATVVWFKNIRALVRSDYSQDPPIYTVSRAQAIFRQQRVVPHTNPVWTNPLQLLQSMGRFAMPAFAAVVLVLVLVLGQQAIVSADGALPGDWLYPVKVNVEGLQLTFASDDYEKADLLLNFAQKRVEEIAALTNQGRYNDIPDTVATYEKTLDQATRVLDQLAEEDPELVAALGSSMDEQSKHNTARLTEVMAQVPAPAKPAIQHAIDVSNKTDTEIKHDVDNAKTKPTVTKPSGSSTATRQPTRRATPTIVPTGKPNQPEKLKTPDKPSNQGDGVKPTKTSEPTPTEKPSKTPEPTPTAKIKPGQNQDPGQDQGQGTSKSKGP